MQIKQELNKIDEFNIQQKSQGQKQHWNSNSGQITIPWSIWVATGLLA